MFVFTSSTSQTKSITFALTHLHFEFQIDKQQDSIDENGLRFLMFVRSFNYLSYILPPNQRPTMLSYRDIVWAYHSESQVRDQLSKQDPTFFFFFAPRYYRH